MTDPILDEIWRVRAELLKQHGGVDGYFRYVQKLDQAHRRRQRAARAKKARQRSKAAK